MTHRNIPIIDDNNASRSPHARLDQQGRGRIKRDYGKTPLGGLECLRDASTVGLIPESEWRDRSAQQWKDESTLWHLTKGEVPRKNQEQTNYCWINAPTWCTEAARCVMGLTYVELSPASVGGPIKGYRNQGGWGTEGLQYIADHGIVPASLWPCNAISARYNTAEANAERAKYRVTEWDDVPADSWKHLISMMLQNKPVAIGLDWWSHEVSAVAVVWEDNDWSLIIANSWGDWGDDGFGKLRGGKKIPDDACCPRVVTA